MYILNEDNTYRKAENAKEFAEQFQNMNRKIAHTELCGTVISTVWLGTDHNYYHNCGAHPLLFETVIFKGNEQEPYVVRYRDWEDAIRGHDVAVRNETQRANR